MTDDQVERLMLNHYELWLAFTAEFPIRKQDRWKLTYSACEAFAARRGP